MTDWQRWHDPYDDPSSELSERLGVVQRRLREWLDEQPPGSLRLLSLCAGQGRDVAGALQHHDRRLDLSGLLVELEPENARAANSALQAAGLPHVHAVVGDAGRTASFAGAVPADLLVLCGVFGNISDSDVQRTVEALPMLCAEGATVVWTRHRRAPDLTPAIRRWFSYAGLDEVDFSSPGPSQFAVGTHRLAAAPRPFESRTLFTFDR